jgi:hypothetical protein
MRGDRRQHGRKTGRLAGEDDDVAIGEDGGIVRGPDTEDALAAPAYVHKAALPQCTQMRPPGQEYDVISGLLQQASVVASDSAGAGYTDPHVHPLLKPRWKE